MVSWIRLAVLSVVSVWAVCAVAETQIIDGVKYECKDGLCYMVGAVDDAAAKPEASADAPRIAQGYMSADQFVAFLENREAPRFGDSGLWLTLLLALLGGLAMNLTPCVLPMIPINLMIIGKSARRGLAYGAGIAIAYGALGVAAAVGGLAFGTIQGSPWFNAVVALVFVVLALALVDVFFIDLSRLRPNVRSAGDKSPNLLFAFSMGALSAVLAGACVAPILISVLLLTAKLYGEGKVLALGLPFVLGAGMALPWPFLGAGMKVLPKPGTWMKRVNRLFALVVLGFAVYYGQLAVRGWLRPAGAPASGASATLATLDARLADAKRPVLVDCWATWCKNCAAMDRVMEEEKVREALKPFTVVRLQAEDISKLRKAKGFEAIQGLPAFVIFE